MKRIITLILAVATFSTIAQDRAGKEEIAKDKGEIRSSVNRLKQDIAEVETMRMAKAEFDAQMKALNLGEMQNAKYAMLKLMSNEVDQVRIRVGIDRAEMLRSVEEAQKARKEAETSKVVKKPAAVADEHTEAKDDRSDLQKQMDLLIEMNRLYFEIQKIELTSKPQRHYEGSILRMAEKFIILMQNDIFETKKEE